MRVLYKPKERMSSIFCVLPVIIFSLICLCFCLCVYYMSFSFCCQLFLLPSHKITQTNSGGRRAGSMSSFICPNCPKLSLTFWPRAGFAIIISYLHYLCKTWPRKNYFADMCKKDLTSRNFARIIGAGLFRFDTSLAYWRRLRTFKKILCNPAKKTWHF